MRQSANIQLILNTNNKLDILKDLFEKLSQKGFGKLKGEHFIVDTDVVVRPTNEVFSLFTRLQYEAEKDGFTKACYCLNIRV